MMLGTEYLSLPLRIATVAVPVAVYFLILGLLNSRKSPQLLTGRQDFCLLIIALSPLVLLPALNYLGFSLATGLGAVVGLAGLIALLAPRGRTWVIYNLDLQLAPDLIARSLDAAGVDYRPTARGFDLGEGVGLEVTALPILRNVSIRLTGGGRDVADRFEQALEKRLARLDAHASPMAVSLLLVATAMLVAPLALMAQRAPEIVRVLTDLLR